MIDGKISAYFIIIILISGTLISPINSFVKNAYAEEDIFPSWVRTIFELYSKKQISDTDLKNALEFLIKEKILIVIDETQKTEQITPQINEGASTKITSVNDAGFLNAAKNAITGIVSAVKKDPTLDLLASSFLPEIPIVGKLLGTLYEKESGTSSEKNTKILKVLEEYQKMDDLKLKVAFSELEKNRAAIENNTYLLENLITDTKKILQITSDTNERVKSLESKLDQIYTLISDVQVGRNTPNISPELKNQLNEIAKSDVGDGMIQEYADLDNTKLNTLAKSYLLQENYGKAIQIYDQILKKDSKNFDALLEKGWALYDSEKYWDSAVVFREFLSYYPNNSEGWEAKGWVLLDLGEPYLDESQNAFIESFKLDSSNAYAKAGIGWVHLEKGDCIKAKQTFNEALKIDLHNEDALEGLDQMKKYYDC